MLLYLVKNDKGLDDQMVECGVTGNGVSILMYIPVNSLAMSEKGVTMGKSWFLSVAFVGITGN